MQIVINGLPHDQHKKLASLWPSGHMWTLPPHDIIIDCTIKTEDPFTGLITLTYHDGPFRCQWSVNRNQVKSLYRRDGI